MTSLAETLVVEVMNRTRTLVGFLDVTEGDTEIRRDIHEVIRTAQLGQPNQEFADALDLLLTHWTVGVCTSFVEFCKERGADLTPLFVEDDE